MRFELKAIKIQEKFLKYLQSILLIGVLALLFWQLSNFDWNSYNWSWPQNSKALILAIILVWANWFFEWLKWKRVTKRIGLTNPEIVQNGFYAGMVTGFLTPSALGNFIGRMALVHKQFKAKIVSFTLFANGAQFLISLFFGALSLMVLAEIPFVFRNLNLTWVITAAWLIGLFLYFTIQRIPFLIKLISRKTPSINEVRSKDKLVFLGFSMLRYLVFSFQFYLVIIAFQPELDFTIWFWVWHIYLWTTLSPSLVMGKLFIRESIAVFVLSFAGVDVPVALMSGLIVWAMNNALPSLFAYIKWKKNVLVQA